MLNEKCDLSAELADMTRGLSASLDRMEGSLDQLECQGAPILIDELRAALADADGRIRRLQAMLHWIEYTSTGRPSAVLSFARGGINPTASEPTNESLRAIA